MLNSEFSSEACLALLVLAGKNLVSKNVIWTGERLEFDLLEKDLSSVKLFARIKQLILDMLKSHSVQQVAETLELPVNVVRLVKANQQETKSLFEIT